MVACLSLTIPSQMKINREKNIGHVIFFVEGVKTEFQYLRAIFERILGYQFHHVKGGDSDIVLRKGVINPSAVLVLNTKGSFIASIEEKDEQTGDDFFFDRQNRRLEGTGFRLNAARIYYIFDRDPKSNAPSDRIRDYLARFSDSLDNGMDRAGMLLLSYPSVEAHLISHFLSMEGRTCPTGDKLKSVLGVLRDKEGCQFSKISKETLLHATAEFLAFYSRELGCEFELDGENQGLAVFQHQEEFYQKEWRFKLFSQLVHALIDLGIIEWDAEELAAD